MSKYTFRELVSDSRTGLNPRKNFSLGQGDNFYITIKDIHNGKIVITDKTDRVDDAAIEIIKKRSRIKNGDILFASIGRIGETAIVTDKNDTWDVNESVFIFTLNTDVITQKFFCSLFQSQNIQEQLNRDSSGSTFKSIKMNQLEKMIFDIPSIEEQKQITSKLDKVSAIIEDRKQQLEKLDLLVKSRFVELFGNPLDGTAKYPIHQVGEVAEAVDPQPSHRTPPIEEGGIPYVSIKDCDYKTGTIDFDGARRVSRKVLEEHLNRYTLQDGDFVIGKIGTIGKPVFVPARNDYTLSANVVLVQPNSELVSPYFLKYSFESDFVERQFSEAKNSTSQAAFGIQKVRAVEVMNPDLDIQRAFERFVKQTDKSKLAVQQSLEKLETLKKSLMQQYFG